MDIPQFPEKSVDQDFIVHDMPLFIEEFEAYFNAQVVGEIQKAMEHELGAAAYILLSCAIDLLASLWQGRDTSAKIYKKFINKFFGNYDGASLYEDLRCGLVHNYTLGEKLIMCWGESDIHMTQTPEGQTVINLEQFFEDFQQAKNRYIAELRQDQQLQDNLSTRVLKVGMLYPIYPDTIRQELGGGDSTTHL